MGKGDVREPLYLKVWALLSKWLLTLKFAYMYLNWKAQKQKST